MTELIVPIARKLVMNQASIPFSMLGKLSGVIRNESDASEIGAAFGRGYRPQKPIMLIGPDEKTVILIVGGEAAEIEDIAIAKFDQQRRLAEKGQRGFKFAEAREAHGMPPIEQVDGMIREAIRERVRKHKRNPVTDPGRNSRKEK